MKNEEIIEHVKANHEKLKSYIAKGIDNGFNIVLIHITGPGAFNKPNFLGINPAFYNAKKHKDKILAEFDANPGKYGYGIFGKQPGGSDYHTVTVYNGIINDEKPFFVEPPVVNPAKKVEKLLTEIEKILLECNNKSTKKPSVSVRWKKFD